MALGATMAAVPASAVPDENPPPPADESLAAAAVEGFTEHLTFEGYTVGPLSGQDGWTAHSSAQVVLDPVNQNNRALELTGPNRSAYRAITEIPDGETGTVFLRMRRDALSDNSFGVTDVDAPSTTSHSRAYVNNQNNDILKVRNGGAFADVGTWSEDVWQCVWIVADNAADRVTVYSQGGIYASQTRLPAGAEQTFGFREAVNGALDRFFWINGGNSNGRIMMDDLAIDPTGANLALPTGNPGDCETVPVVEQPLLNPLPDPTPVSLGIEVEELAQLPASTTTPATQDQRLIRHNRVQHVDEVPDGSGRLAVPDMNAILYLVDEDTGEYVDYLNVRNAFIDNFHNHAGLGTGLGFAEFHPDFATNGKFYTVHTEAGTALTQDTPDFPAYGSTGFHSVLTEWTATDPAAERFAGTNREVLRVPFNGRVHTMQQIAFNPTVEPGDADYGNLYLLVGDGGNGVNNANPQNLATPQGTIMRINPLGTDSANGSYGVPADNPFVGTAGALPEIYAVGMRDPHRISWDLEGDHTLYMAHIGEWQVESVYAVEPGDNFGWSEREGSFVARDRQIFPLPADDATEFDFTYPVAAYDHNRDPGQTGDAGVAVNGGFVYRGDIEALQGKYLFTDLVRGWVLSTEADEMIRNDGDPADLAEISQLKVFVDGEETTFSELVGSQRVDLRFGSDGENQLYLVSKADGKIWKVVGAREGDVEPPFEAAPQVLPELASNLVAHYAFDTPAAGDLTKEADLGQSGTTIDLVNGGREMRVHDAAYPGAGRALQTQQLSKNAATNDDWKAGVYNAAGVETLRPFNGADATSIMGWFKPTGEMPALNSNTADLSDRYNAIGLAGILSGSSDGHAVRSLLEVINVNGKPHVVGLARRVDTGSSWTYAAELPWDEILRKGEWVHLSASFDFVGGTMALYMNGEPLDGFYSPVANPWGAGGSSDTDPRGIKIGGSYPQNTREQNPFNGRMDDLMFLDTAVTPEQVAAQYARYAVEEPTPTAPAACSPDELTITDVAGAGNWAPRTPSKWQFTNGEVILAEAGTNPNDGIRRPFEYAVLSEGPVLGDVVMEAEVKLDAPPDVNNRDVILVFGHTSDTEYYYAHLSQDNTIYAHNGIFKVDGVDRERIDDQWNGTIGAPPAVTDDDWHQVRLTHCVETGEISVQVDGLSQPLLTATDSTFTEGRVGFGSFDNTGRLRNLTVTATPVEEPVVPAAVIVTPATAELEVGETVQLSAAVVPAGAPQEVTWSSSAVGAATVSESGLVTSVAPGTATVTATSVADGAVAGTATITVVEADVPPEPITFVDVAEGDLFFDEITWLAGRGITRGWTLPDGSTEFRPVTPIARDAMAAFLYRFAGSPDFTAPEVSPFSDVATDNQFYEEIAWLAEAEISTGWDNGDGTASFRPLEPIARDAIAAFLHRYAEGAGLVDQGWTPPVVSPFSDVSTGNQFYAEIAWLADSKIATGWIGEGNDGRDIFRPLNPVNRDAMAAFLFRLDQRR
ncbi:glucose dehydrogenase [Serinibacter arcticus]|uniref:Glucose dehydrogenase n=1 Tax=Serinibacter arcticus TaxID=1655435 RepID=A0A2U1ZTV8_9MICO|nr:glucose dehydrogenase [Serinibacter arcticus]